MRLAVNHLYTPTNHLALIASALPRSAIPSKNILRKRSFFMKAVRLIFVNYWYLADI